jgi:hypothetical protein
MIMRKEREGIALKGRPLQNYNVSSFEDYSCLA